VISSDQSNSLERLYSNFIRGIRELPVQLRLRRGMEGRQALPRPRRTEAPTASPLHPVGGVECLPSRRARGPGEFGLCLRFRVEVQTLIEKPNVHLLSWTLGPSALNGSPSFNMICGSGRRTAWPNDDKKGDASAPARGSAVRATPLARAQNEAAVHDRVARNMIIDLA
jgi:hypothetical protein